MSESKLVDLSTFTYDTMLPHVGSQFRLDFDDGTTIVLELIRVDRLMDKHSNPKLTRDSFALIFRGPVETMLPQRMYSMQHDVLGPLGIFIVPVAREPEGYRYEAIFA